MLSQRGQNAKYWNYVGGVVGLRLLVYHQTIFDNNVVLISKKKKKKLRRTICQSVTNNSVKLCLSMYGFGGWGR